LDRNRPRDCPCQLIELLARVDQIALAHNGVAVEQRFRLDHGAELRRTAELDVWFNDPNPRRAEAVARDLTTLLTSAALPPGQELVVLRPTVRGPGKLPMRVFGRYQSDREVFGYAALAGAIVGLLLGLIRRVTRKTPLPV
jgi:hypothetical protein